MWYGQILRIQFIISIIDLRSMMAFMLNLVAKAGKQLKLFEIKCQTLISYVNY